MTKAPVPALLALALSFAAAPALASRGGSCSDDPVRCVPRKPDAPGSRAVSSRVPLATCGSAAQAAPAAAAPAHPAPAPAAASAPAAAPAHTAAKHAAPHVYPPPSPASPGMGSILRVMTGTDEGLSWRDPARAPGTILA